VFFHSTTPRLGLYQALDYYRIGYLASLWI